MNDLDICHSTCRMIITAYVPCYTAQFIQQPCDPSAGIVLVVSDSQASLFLYQCNELTLAVCLCRNVSTTIDPFWDISLDLGPPDFEGLSLSLFAV